MGSAQPVWLADDDEACFNFNTPASWQDDPENRPGYSSEPKPSAGAAQASEQPSADGSMSVRVVSIGDFIAVNEAGAEPLVGVPGAVVIPEGGDVMIYGQAGTGKTTLEVDFACHLAGGDDWLGIPITRPLRVLLAENEGPRPLLREKLRQKMAGWQGSAIGDRIQVVEEPWAWIRFNDRAGREALAKIIRDEQIDVVCIGPVTAVGMEAAGTLQDVRAFTSLINEVRQLSGRRVTFVLIHHENKGGTVSGAWEGVGDTLIHVSLVGRGNTQLRFQKVRWSSTHHATSLQLTWVEPDGFTVANKPVFDPDALAGQILAHIAEHPGIGWSRVEEATPGIAKATRKEIRDRLLGSGAIVNLGRDEDDREALLDHIPERKPARLYTSDDPSLGHLRRAPGATATNADKTRQLHLRRAPGLNRRSGVGAADPYSESDLWDDELGGAA
jgi:hypothetical protein